MFRVYLTSRAEREFNKLPNNLRQKFYNAFKKLSENPAVGTNIKKIRGTEQGYRLRLGRWRILFTLFLQKKRIEVIDIFLKKGKEDYGRRRELLK